MNRIFAHAGELHTNSYTVTSHLIFGRWYIALGLLILLLLIVARITSIITKGSHGAIFLMLMLTLLLVGMTTYALSTVVSVVSLTTGFVMALLSTMTGLSKPDSNSNREKESKK